mmetsp:Transcript_35503/g.68062  ORF Transcript_35503/g.68062 Transcript_35503/m.68062 type:complete len:361 (+) Transcript_35503:176-1258(+)
MNIKLRSTVPDYFHANTVMHHGHMVKSTLQRVQLTTQDNTNRCTVFRKPTTATLSTAVAIALEVDVKVHDTALKRALETLLVAVLPVLIDNLKGNILVGRTGVKDQQRSFAVLGAVGHHFVGGGLGLVDKVRVEDVELIALHHLRRRVVVVVVRLIVLVPFIAGMHSVEVLGLARAVLVVPPVRLLLQHHLPAELHLPPVGNAHGLSGGVALLFLLVSRLVHHDVLHPESSQRAIQLVAGADHLAVRGVPALAGPCARRHRRRHAKRLAVHALHARAHLRNVLLVFLRLNHKLADGHLLRTHVHRGVGHQPVGAHAGSFVVDVRARGGRRLPLRVLLVLGTWRLRLVLLVPAHRVRHLLR